MIIHFSNRVLVARLIINQKDQFPSDPMDGRILFAYHFQWRRNYVRALQMVLLPDYGDQYAFCIKREHNGKRAAWKFQGPLVRLY